MVIEVLSEHRVLIYWFSYDSIGNPAWFFGVGEIEESSIIVEELFITRGGRFGPMFDPAEVEYAAWGSAVVELGCDYGKLDYAAVTDRYGAGKQTLNRLTGPGNFDCTDPSPRNILLVIADDLGQDSSNQYSISAQQPFTPTLDMLAG